MRRTRPIPAAVAALALLAISAHAATDGPTNVLFICVDDLRPALGCYGDGRAATPHIDRLASGGLLLSRAYCQQAVCNPSRASVLTGLRPDATGVEDNAEHFRLGNPGVVTLPQHFKTHGYRTRAVGKVFHSSWEHAYCGDRLDDPPSWSERSWWPDARYYYTEEGSRIAREVFLRHPSCGLDADEMCIHYRLQPEQRLPGVRGEDWARHFVMGPINEAPNVDDSALYDGRVADKAIEALRSMAGGPFFLAVGFLRPHIPFVAPERYWRLHPSERFAETPEPTPPIDAPEIATRVGQSVRAYYGVPETGPIEPALAVELTRGYYASVSYIDAQLGRILDELDRLDLADRTVVIFWSDHGFHLGEQGLWNKETLFESSTRVPLIVRAPGRVSPPTRSDALVELVDLYPTLCDLAGLPTPDHIEGTSFAPLATEPGAAWKRGAFSQYPRPGGILGRSVRTDRYRLSIWSDRADAAREAGVELYDYERDPSERRNVASQPEYAAAVSELRSLLQQGWRAALPQGISP